MPISCKGFTLIELMIAISIIAVLSIVGIVVYSSVLQSSRDSKRISDLKFIQSALEDYHADNLAYPVDLDALNPVSGRKYLTNVPVDPVSSPHLQYHYTRSGITYCLYADLEGSSVPASDMQSTSCLNPPSSDYDYGVTRP